MKLLLVPAVSTWKGCLSWLGKGLPVHQLGPAIPTWDGCLGWRCWAWRPTAWCWWGPRPWPPCRRGIAWRSRPAPHQWCPAGHLHTQQGALKETVSLCFRWVFPSYYMYYPFKCNNICHRATQSEWDSGTPAPTELHLLLPKVKIVLHLHYGANLILM